MMMTITMDWLFVNAVIVWSRSFVGFSILYLVSKLIWVSKDIFKGD